MGETGCLVKERINIYRQHIRQPQYQRFHIFPFFKILQGNKSLRKSYEDYLIDKFKPLHLWSIKRLKSQNFLK